MRLGSWESWELPWGQEVVFRAGKNTQAVSVTLVVEERPKIDRLNVAARRGRVERAGVAVSEGGLGQLYPLQLLERATCDAHIKC